jgi:ribosome-binding factor A
LFLASNRPDRVGEQIRQELSELIAREVHDPGIGFVTLTRVKVTSDLQLARVYYTLMGDEKARRETAKALKRAAPFLRHHISQRVRLRRAPELEFFFDESVAHQDRIEQILQELKAETESRREDPLAPEPREQSVAQEVPAGERASRSGGAKPLGPKDEDDDPE